MMQGKMDAESMLRDLRGFAVGAYNCRLLYSHRLRRAQSHVRFQDLLQTFLQAAQCNQNLIIGNYVRAAVFNKRRLLVMMLSRREMRSCAGVRSFVADHFASLLM